MPPLVSYAVSIVLNVLKVVMLVGGSAGAKLGSNGTSVRVPGPGSRVPGPGSRVPGPGYTVGLILAVIGLLAVIVTPVALSVRRLHDTNMSGWMILLVLFPVVGPVPFIIVHEEQIQPRIRSVI
jgi:uncharacterized membrane protein YhaH (DUF805 family)